MNVERRSSTAANPTFVFQGRINVGIASVAVGVPT